MQLQLSSPGAFTIPDYNGATKRNQIPFDTGKYQEQNPADDQEIHERFAWDRRYSEYHEARGEDGLVLADYALRARGMIGLLIGSAAKRCLIGQDIHKSKDIDVLILEPFTQRVPAPNAYGLDWWVRPTYRYPTNGRINLLYDIRLKPGIRCTRHATRSRLGVALNPVKMHIVENLNTTRDLCNDAGELLPGLYLPDAKIQWRIAAKLTHNAETHRELCAHVIKELRQELKIGTVGRSIMKTFSNNNARVKGRECDNEPSRGDYQKRFSTYTRILIEHCLERSLTMIEEMGTCQTRKLLARQSRKRSRAFALNRTDRNVDTRKLFALL